MGRIFVFGAVIESSSHEVPISPTSIVEAAQVRLRRERIRKVVGGK